MLERLVTVFHVICPIFFNLKRVHCISIAKRREMYTVRVWAGLPGDKPLTGAVSLRSRYITLVTDSISVYLMLLKNWTDVVNGCTVVAAASAAVASVFPWRRRNAISTTDADVLRTALSASVLLCNSSSFDAAVNVRPTVLFCSAPLPSPTHPPSPSVPFPFHFQHHSAGPWLGWLAWMGLPVQCIGAGLETWPLTALSLEEWLNVKMAMRGR